MGRSSKNSVGQTLSILKFLQIVYFFPYALSFMAFFNYLKILFFLIHVYLSENLISIFLT